MKKILTLDEAFNEQNFEVTEAAVFDLNKVGVYDPNFVPLVERHATTTQAKAAVGELTPKSHTVRVYVQ